MNWRSVGIVGGAGPVAGFALAERIVRTLQQDYGCEADSEFPRIIVISYPFTEMLMQKPDVAQTRRELATCLGQLREMGADVAAIACNTLHAFVENEMVQGLTLIELPALIPDPEVVVLCSSTARAWGVHQPCLYPLTENQDVVDQLIQSVLTGGSLDRLRNPLSRLVQAVCSEARINRVVLGCTELSLIGLSVPGIEVIDPLELVVSKICKTIGDNKS